MGYPDRCVIYRCAENETNAVPRYWFLILEDLREALREERLGMLVQGVGLTAPPCWIQKRGGNHAGSLFHDVSLGARPGRVGAPLGILMRPLPDMPRPSSPLTTSRTLIADDNMYHRPHHPILSSSMR
eukprot:scaffold19153_cov52-Cyclotella_meneghiniana.AAC.3